MTQKANSEDFICFSHLRWNFVYQRPQHLLSRFAKKQRLFYVEYPVITDIARPKLEINRTQEEISVITPHLPSGLDSTAYNTMQKLLLDDHFSKQNIANPILWYYDPLAFSYTKHLNSSIVVYDCMDELSKFLGAPPEIAQAADQLCRKADLIFTGGISLYESKRHLYPNVHAFPSSVDLAHFIKAREPQAEPPDQITISHPRLGFFGVIDERLDLPLLESLAQRNPDWQIVLVGPVVKISPDSLPRLKNIHYLGQKSYEALPSYLCGWDVALLPFARNDATLFISPTKTPEYMAGGKPVVSTSIRDVVSPYGEKGMVRIADRVEDFERAIRECLSEDLGSKQKEIDEFLKGISWDKTWSSMNHLIETRLKNKIMMHPISMSYSHRPGLADPQKTISNPLNQRGDGNGKAAAMVKPQPLKKAGKKANPYDYLIVGAGFAGSVVAERLASAGKKVLICDKRAHIGGNAYDCMNKEGIFVHQYGPHIFHTNSQKVVEYLSHFTEWTPYEHKVLASVDDKLLPIPINLDTVNMLYGLNLNSQELANYFREVAEPCQSIHTSEDVIVSKIGRDLYNKFFKNYTRKQWGLDPSQLDSSVIGRIPVRTDRDARYFADAYQQMPKEGFTAMFKNMLSSSNIRLELEVDYKDLMRKLCVNHVIYSGPVDEYFNYCYGHLPYRSLNFRFETHEKEFYQEKAVINYPNEHDYTRVSEFKYITGQKNSKTSIAYEYPQSEGDPYYPIPRPENNLVYNRYKTLAEKTSQVHFVGRLGTYKYYNMDQVVAQALNLASILTEVEVHSHPLSGFMGVDDPGKVEQARLVLGG